jgi:toxin CcdB
MARFDVYRLTDGGLVIDCQADFLDDIGTRFIAPLLPPGEAPPSNGRLNPIVEVNGESLVMVTQFATAVRTSELRSRITSLDRDHLRIIGAIDVLTGSG